MAGWMAWWMALSLAAPAAAASDTPPAGSERTPAFFVLGPQTVGLTLGYGHGVPAIAAGRVESGDVRMLVVTPSWQMDVTRRPLEPAWYKGSLAVRLEPTFLVNFSPRNGFATGAALTLRYRLRRWEPIVPYLELGAGIVYLDFDVVDQVDGLGFIPQAGAGVSWRHWEHVSVELGVRLQHISNAYTRLPNEGIDTVQVLLGVVRHFD